MAGIMKAPFPYFGGKASVASIVWQALGQPKAYLEPFFGSGAVLFARPGGAHGKETVCDADGFIANVWRGIQFAPDEIARWCDWPISHIDLMARRKELIKNEERLLENLIADPLWYDAVLAGYWIWAASCWIGAGLTRPNAMPDMTREAGVHATGKRPTLTEFAEQGIHAGPIPSISHAPNTATRSDAMYSWMRALSDRLRAVRVVCGDWTRICGGDWQDHAGVCGMFFDPPYGVSDRASGIYHHESLTVAADVNAWVLDRGARSSYRIVLAGYREEHQNLLSAGWTERIWKACGGYGNRSKSKGRTGNQNENRETLFFSPHCLINPMLDL